MKTLTLESLPPVYWIGGSPCSGKSSVAEAIANKHGLASYNCDEAYYRHLESISPDQFPRLFRARHASPEEVWILRGVDQQVEDEIALYREEFPLILNDLEAMPLAPSVVAEGAALLPSLVAKAGISGDRALWIVPTEAFQLEHYARRPWRHDVVKDCSDPQQAWENWMARDFGFAKAVAAEANAFGFEVITVDGSRSIEETVRFVEEHFGL
jgi:2-phosphoglycerate kinase